VKEQNKLQESSRDKVKGHSETQTVIDTAKKARNKESEGLKYALLGTMFSARGEFKKAIEYHKLYY